MFCLGGVGDALSCLVIAFVCLMVACVLLRVVDVRCVRVSWFLLC